ncbi:hypothetical protein HII36_21685 [Nonomuraea sp. NN258]|uniref:Wzz/FepE/Etk N-terminal domain-containing protein n=1 Tax=Nonomuraea antri TaxID=2730852 RepID=UPI00156940FD|nr:Wzz/FepE/Etk N-terminal domain-containing protein [Nonomuraea antri]NRQ34445.1 hypothetical protein [Nonomuraea antri]
MSQTPESPARRSGTDLGEHFALLRRRWLLFAGCVVFGGTAGLAVLRMVPPAYTATTQVLVTPVGQEPGNQVTGRQRESLNLDTEAQIAQSAVVAARAAPALQRAALDPVEVSVPPNSAVLWISVTAADPGSAAAQSRAYAEAYLAHRHDSAAAAATAQQQAVLDKLKQVNTGLDEVVEELDGLPRSGSRRALATHRQAVLNRQAAALALKYDALKTATINPGSIISQAAVPTAPSSPRLPLCLGTGLMLGLLAGAAAAHLRDRLDTRLRTAADVERLTGLPVLADLSWPRHAGVLHDLACAVVAAIPGKRLLIRALPADLRASPAEPLPLSAPVMVLDGSDVRDLARADAALLLLGLDQVDADEVAAAVRELARHGVPVIGVVTATGALPSFVPVLESPAHTPLGKLVATGETPRISTSAETTPMQAIHPRPTRPT